MRGDARLLLPLERTDAMILRRLALFVALLLGFLATQVPEFVQQYRQRLGGAIDELTDVVSRFDSDSALQGLTQSGGIDRLRSNGDHFVRQRGDQEQDNVIRLQRLREAQAQFRSDGPVAQYGTLLTHFDDRIAEGALRDFSPAVPTTPQGFVFGLLGFVLGGGVVHLAGRPLRRRVRREREMTRTA